MSASSPSIVRCRLHLRGQVQGVGFRPFVYRLAQAHRLAGFVANDGNGAVIEVEGPATAIDAFRCALREQLPPLARITQEAAVTRAPRGDTEFTIERSEAQPHRRPEVTPDAATCADCLRELLAPPDRRYRYPFINCTNCGPRYSIICGVPYDRLRTTMAKFAMCDPCAQEYGDPAHRRFHAQPNACPACGPTLQLHRPDCSMIPGDPIFQSAQLLADGSILAVKGIGGYHLACRADAEPVVAELRRRKIRDGKPLAVMVADVPTAARLCDLTPAAVAALTSPAAPIVLAPQRPGHRLAASVAGGCSDFGVMLPYTPVHHLLFAEGLGPLVMTSGNLSGQPLTYRDEEAMEALGAVADAFLTHNRDIYRPIDDSVVLAYRDEVLPVRRARGYAPQPIHAAVLGAAVPAESSSDGILAVGGELKSTVCLYRSSEATLSEHLGDLTHAEAYRNYVRAIERLQELLAFEPRWVAHDLHPQYLSTRYAVGTRLPCIPVQHHHAHIAAVMAEHGLPGPVVGLACDGTGYGTDGAVWGCEVLWCDRGCFRRLGHLEYFPLIGGDAAAVETWRPAVALLRQAMGDRWHRDVAALLDAEIADAANTVDAQVSAGINTPPTSSLGRVFDAVACLTGLCARNRHEAEAAMALEAAAGTAPAEPYAWTVSEAGGMILLSVRETLMDVASAVQAGQPVRTIAARFHEAVARLLSDAAQRACASTGVQTVALSGGCFCNRRLLARVTDGLGSRGLTALYHRVVPCGDGGISLGQTMVAAWRVAEASQGPACGQSPGAPV